MLIPLAGWHTGRVANDTGGGLSDCVSHVCGGEGGCAGDGVPLGAVPVLSWCGEVSLGGYTIIITAGSYY